MSRPGWHQGQALDEHSDMLGNEDEDDGIDWSDVDESFHCNDCGQLMDDNDMYDEHEPRCPGREE